MPDKLVPCTTCGLDRLESSLDKYGRCPFCVEEGREPPPKHPEIIVKPRKTAAKKGDEAPPAAPDAPVATKPPAPAVKVPRALRPEDQPTVDEAYAIPYTPPVFDQAVAQASPQREMAMRELCRRRFLPFVQRFRPKYLAGWVHEDICRRLERFVKDVEAGKSPRLLLMMPPRAGKLLADDTLVPTPLGYQAHGALRPGDEVFHPSGRAVTVVAISPKDTADVRMTFSDGSSYLCHENHEWVLFDRKRGEWRTFEAGHFLRPSHLGTRPGLLCNGRAIYQLPVVSALEYRNSFYTLHPYALGAWLGDGSAGKACITGDRKDKAIIEKIESLGYPVSAVCEHKTTGVLTTYFSGPRPNVSGRLTTELQRLGIYTQKRIPSEYQRLRTDLRLELLAGLIDTDGTTDKNSRISITTVSRELAGDILQLCEGLGFRPYMREVQPALSSSGIQGKKVCYVVGFQPTRDIPVTLERKRVTRFARQRRVGLVSVERVPTEQAKTGHCIQVDSSDGLYVVGEKLTTTHNSELGSRHFPAWVLGQHPDWEIIAASHTSSLTLSFSRYIRDLIRDPAYQVLFPEMRLDPGSQSVENWNTLSGGGYLAAGVGTGITGRGAHILLLDDLVKDIEAADSITIKENTWEWYGSTAYTRLAPGGGVLGIMCMTGDTPVMMADGTQRRLDTLKPSDEIATYACGLLGATRVAAMWSSGHDSVFKITMKSGKIVRANQRHPFLTVAPSGEVSWTRLKNLTTAHRIVTVKGSGANGAGSPVLPRDATSLRSVVAFATATTPRNAGRTDIVPQPTGQPHVETPASNIGTASLLQSTTQCTIPRGVAVPSAENPRQRETPLATGKINSQSTIATTQEKSEGCFVTTATQESDTLRMSRWHYPPLGISDFTLDEIARIEADGEEEVFDVQVNCTENFIANGLVSHNTWWNEDDWAGRIQQVMASGEGDTFEVIRYPAINDEGDEYILWKEPGEPIRQFSPGSSIPDGATMTRPMNTAIHPARYTTEAMLRIKRNMMASGQQRVWNALYQQNPTPDDGTHFTKEMVQYFIEPPQRRNVTRFQAWDFAITEDQKNDYTVCVTADQDQHNNLYIVDVFRFRSNDGNAIVEHMIDQIFAWGPDFLGVEDGQIWKTMKSQFETRCQERQVYQSYEVLQPLTDKIVRAAPLRGRMQLKKVFIRKGMPWTEAFVRELMVFPGGKHDDQVDAAAWATRLTLQHMPKKPPEPPKPKSWKDRLGAIADGTAGASHMAA